MEHVSFLEGFYNLPFNYSNCHLCDSITLQDKFIMFPCSSPSLKVQAFIWDSLKKQTVWIIQSMNADWSLEYLCLSKEAYWSDRLIVIICPFRFCSSPLFFAGYRLGADREACVWAGVHKSILSRPPLLFPDRKSVRAR